MSGGSSRRIFVSYRRDDTRHVAGRVFDRLTERFGDGSVFMDVDSIEPGLDFGAAIEHAVAECDVLLALIGHAWLGETDEQGHRRLDDPEDLIVLEIKSALDRDIRVIPVLIDGAAAPRRDELPEVLRPLARRNAVRLDHETFRLDVGPLMDVLDQAARPTSSVVSPTAVPTNPPVPRERSLVPSQEAERPVEHCPPADALHDDSPSRAPATDPNPTSDNDANRERLLEEARGLYRAGYYRGMKLGGHLSWGQIDFLVKRGIVAASEYLKNQRYRLQTSEWELPKGSKQVIEPEEVLAEYMGAHASQFADWTPSPETTEGMDCALRDLRNQVRSAVSTTAILSVSADDAETTDHPDR